MILCVSLFVWRTIFLKNGFLFICSCRFYTISGSLKDTPPAKDAHIEMWDRHLDCVTLLPLLYGQFALFPALCLVPCPTLTQSHAACHPLWHHQLLTFVAGGSWVSLLVCTHVGSPCAIHNSPPLLPRKHVFPTRFSSICGVALSLQWIQHTSAVLCKLLDFTFEYYRQNLSVNAFLK